MLASLRSTGLRAAAGLRVASVAAPAAAALPARFATEWLQGKPPSVSYDAGTLAAFYYKNVKEFDLPTKDHLFAAQQDEKFNVQQFDTYVNGYAVGLVEGYGVKKGTKVALWMGNDVENLILQYACALVGATVVSVDPALDFAAVKQILAAEDVRILILSSRYGAEARGEKLASEFAAELAPFTGGKRYGYAPLQSKTFRSLKYIVQTSNEPVEGVVRLVDVPVFGEDGSHEVDTVAAVQTYLQPSDAITVHYSAGAAGPAKGSTLSHKESLAAGAAAAAAAGLKSTDSVVVTAPLHTQQAFAACLGAAGAHARTVIPSKSFDAVRTLKAISQQRATAVVATQEQVAALNAALAADAKKEHNVSTVRTGLVIGGAADAKFANATLKAFK